jgi:serine/threonine protein kinase
MSFSTADYSEWSLRGEGGEAEIFRARQVSLDRLVAIKRLKLSTIGDAEDIKRFEREAKLCASLIHPNLIPIFDYGSEGNFYYLVMEFVHGVDLGKIADLAQASATAPTTTAATAVKTSNLDGTPSRPEKPPLPETLKVHLARQMVEVVEFIQQKGVLHRDLKPENFMADSAARIKLLDLGMARAQSHTHTDTAGNALKGTLAYLPPELLRGQGPLDKSSEFYSLALVILELFQGSRYYRGKTSDEVVGLIQSGIPLESMDRAPQNVRTLLAPYLDSDPKKRPTTLEPLLKGLKAMQGNTLAIAGGREALHTVIRREQRAWLWAMVRASEGEGRVEDAFERLRELLETDPDDSEAQAKFQELGMRLNDSPETGAPMASGKSPAPIANPSSPIPVPQPHGAASNSRLWVATAVFFAAAAIGAIFYLRDRPLSGDMGRDLMKREMSQLSREDEAASGNGTSAGNGAAASNATGPNNGVGAGLSAKQAAGAKTASTAVHKPSLAPYGILIVSGVPKEYRLLVNRVRYPSSGEIHLPATKHLLEIQDAGSHSIIKDTVTVGGGEPTVFDFQRRAGKQ